MKTIYELTENNWREDFFYCYGPQAKDTSRIFTESDRDERGALVGGYDKKINGYDYISLLTNKKYSNKVTATLKCSYQGTGAPLIVFSDDLEKDGNALRYVLHFEVVAHKNGCNIWHVVPRPETPEWPVKSTKIAFDNFPIEEDSEIEIEVTIKGKNIFSTVNGHKISVTDPDIPDNFHIGFTTCEGVCKLWEFSVED